VLKRVRKDTRCDGDRWSGCKEKQASFAVALFEACFGKVFLRATTSKRVRTAEAATHSLLFLACV